MGFLDWLVRDSRVRFKALLKMDVDTYVRTELFQDAVLRLISNKEKSAKHKPFVYGLGAYYRAPVCSIPLKSVKFNSGLLASGC